VRIHCPVCGRENDAGPDFACRRCGCNFGDLDAVLASAAHHLAAAAAALRERDWQAALGGAERSWRLRHRASAARLAFLAAVSIGDTRLAASWLKCCASIDEESFPTRPNILTLRGIRNLIKKELRS
jgi:hypothetical protein